MWVKNCRLFTLLLISVLTALLGKHSWALFEHYLPFCKIETAERLMKTWNETARTNRHTTNFTPMAQTCILFSSSIPALLSFAHWKVVLQSTAALTIIIIKKLLFVLKIFSAAPTIPRRNRFKKRERKDREEQKKKKKVGRGSKFGCGGAQKNMSVWSTIVSSRCHKKAKHSAARGQARTNGVGQTTIALHCQPIPEQVTHSRRTSAPQPRRWKSLKEERSKVGDLCLWASPSRQLKK